MLQVGSIVIYECLCASNLLPKFRGLQLSLVLQLACICSAFPYSPPHHIRCNHGRANRGYRLPPSLILCVACYLRFFSLYGERLIMPMKGEKGTTSDPGAPGHLHVRVRLHTHARLHTHLRRHTRVRVSEPPDTCGRSVNSRQYWTIQKEKRWVLMIIPRCDIGGVGEEQ